MPLLCALFLVAGCAGRTGRLPKWTAVPTPVPGGLYVDAAAGRGSVNRFDLGANYGPWMGVPVDLVSQYDKSGLTLLRFPGGNWGDQNDLEEYQVDQFIALARTLGQRGAEPLICVRLEKGSPEKAAALVKYAKDKGYNVRYWSIGNEPSLYATRDPGYDTARYNREWREFAQAMKAADASIKLVGPDTNQFTGDPAIDPKDQAGRDWLREFLKANGSQVDVVSVHRYPFPKNVSDSPPTPDELMAEAPAWSGMVRNLRAAVRESAGRDLPIAITEFNSNWANVTGADTTPDSPLGAVWLADVMGQLIRERVDMAAYFALRSAPGTGGYGLMATYEVRPSYYVYQMYQQFGAELVQASSDRPDLALYAARKDDGALTLVVVNRSAQPISISVRLVHFAVSGQAQVQVLNAEHMLDRTGSADAAPSFTYEFPPRSAVLMTIPGQVKK